MTALFHLWSSPRPTSLFLSPASLAVSHVGVAAAAAATLAGPSRPWRLLALAVVELWSVYLEAPLLGNHWLVVGLVDLALVAGAIESYARHRRLVPEAIAAAAFPAARWTLIVSYAFAALAKLNQGFFDPAVSCATLFARETVTSWGLDARPDAWWEPVMPPLVAAVELLIPLLLLSRRTRHLGVLVGVSFHFIVALDRAHPFYDYSAVLFALFILFLPLAFSRGIVEGWTGWTRPRVTLLLAIAVGAAVGAVLNTSLARALVIGREPAWYGAGGLAVVVLVAFLRRRPEPEPRLLRSPALWVMVVPLVAVLNGLTPYLEVKSTYGFDMYSNLVTRGGHSNHLVVRRTLPLTDRQADLVRVLWSSDRRLQRYSDEGWDVPWLVFRDYLSRRPGVAVSYERKGRRHDLARAGDDPAVVEAVPAWERRLFAYHLVDQRDPPRCRTAHLVAREGIVDASASRPL